MKIVLIKCDLSEENDFDVIRKQKHSKFKHFSGRRC